MNDASVLPTPTPYVAMETGLDGSRIAWTCRSGYRVGSGGRTRQAGCGGQRGSVRITDGTAPTGGAISDTPLPRRRGAGRVS